VSVTNAAVKLFDLMLEALSALSTLYYVYIYLFVTILWSLIYFAW